jgi:hypothetical protein
MMDIKALWRETPRWTHLNYTNFFDPLVDVRQTIRRAIDLDPVKLLKVWQLEILR